MRHRIIIAAIFWISIFTATITGCSPESGPEQNAATVRSAYAFVLHDGLRFRRDEARNRVWLLGLDNVRVYEGDSKRLIREIALPNWSVARFACDPDIVLDGSGSAIISSNVQARLWRIHADTFHVSEYQIALEGRERWDVGFGALVVGDDGTLLALTSVSESLWRIDLKKGSARMITPTTAILGMCGPKAGPEGKAAGGLKPSGRKEP